MFFGKTSLLRTCTFFLTSKIQCFLAKPVYLGLVPFFNIENTVFFAKTMVFVYYSVTVTVNNIFFVHLFTVICIHSSFGIPSAISSNTFVAIVLSSFSKTGFVHWTVLSVVGWPKTFSAFFGSFLLSSFPLRHCFDSTIFTGRSFFTNFRHVNNHNVSYYCFHLLTLKISTPETKPRPWKTVAKQYSSTH